MKILFIMQFADAVPRMREFCQAFQILNIQVDLVALDSALPNAAGNVLSYSDFTLTNYLENHGHTLDAVMLDSPQSLLTAMRYIKLFCAKAYVLCQLRAGPLAEFVAASNDFKVAIKQNLKQANFILATGITERRYAIELGVANSVISEITTPIKLGESVSSCPGSAVSIVGNLSHAVTKNKFDALLQRLKTLGTELQLFVETGHSAASPLEELPKHMPPKIRIFISDTKEYDNALVLRSLAQGVPVIASDPAVFGLNLVHSEQYLAANHPRTVAARLVQLLIDNTMSSRLAASGLEFIKSNHSASKFEIAFSSIVQTLRSKIQAGCSAGNAPN